MQVQTCKMSQIPNLDIRRCGAKVTRMGMSLTYLTHYGSILRMFFRKIIFVQLIELEVSEGEAFLQLKHVRYKETEIQQFQISPSNEFHDLHIYLIWKYPFMKIYNNFNTNELLLYRKFPSQFVLQSRSILSLCVTYNYTRIIQN